MNMMMNMGSMNMNSNSSMTDDTTTMTTTFSQWQSYRLHLLFSTWDIQNPWEFALTFFAVLVAAIFFHLVDCFAECFQKGMTDYLNESSPVLLSKNEKEEESKEVNPSAHSHVHNRPRGWTLIILLYGTICASKYAIGLFLMLIAMTMNPSLFLALFIGYWIGDFIFCDWKLNLLAYSDRPLMGWGSIVRKALRWIYSSGGSSSLPLIGAVHNN